MATCEFILAVDIGTGATKAVVFDRNLSLVSIAIKHYPVLVTQKNWSEQVPDEILTAVLKAMREAISSLPQGAELLGISFSSQLYSILAVNAQGEAVTNSIPWSDTRTAQIVQEIRNLPEASEIYRSTGDPIDTIYPLSKILWMKRHLELPSDVRFISIKDYIIHKFCGQYMVDWSVASASGLFDVHNRRWDDKALALLTIVPEQLSNPVPPHFIIRNIDREIAKTIGISTDTPLIIGAGDGPLASLGVGACNADILAINVGTSAAARLIVNEPWIDPGGKLYTQILDRDHWIVGGMVSSGGIVYEWFLNNNLANDQEADLGLHQGDIHKAAEYEASLVPAGSDGLIFIPYLSGEQCPGWRAETRGAFWGFDFHHHRGHMLRAVLEGITFSINRIVERIQNTRGEQFKEVRVSGGLSSSALWLQIAADTFGYPVVVPASSEGSARGAAALAMLALGIQNDLSFFSDYFEEKIRVIPNPDSQALYRRQYTKFLKLLDLSHEI